MKKKYLLPKIKNDMASVDTNECWENFNKIYDFLLENMELYYEPKSSIFEYGSDAYPHIFEQMLLFHNAFLDKDDPDHNRAIAEWRACLAILALPFVMNLQLDMIRVDFQSSNNVFLQAAAHFKPEESPVFYLTTWDYSYVLCMNNEPIAILSPITLICPAKRFRNRIKDLRWIIMERQDGVEKIQFNFHGKGNEFSYLRFWLKQLSSKLKRNPDDLFTEDTYRKVMHELKCFIEYAEKEGTAESEVKIRDKLYYNMNISSRNEYKFFNFCCDFDIYDPALEFLKQCYHNDIFQDKLLIIVYDNQPDAMFDQEKIVKLDDLFQQIPRINGERLIAVRESGGSRIPVYILLPFRDSFAKELSYRRILLEKVVDECKVEYIKDTDEISIVIRIKSFPKALEKVYARTDWKYIYGTKMPSTYIWPRCQMNQDKWKAYYLFFARTPEIKVEVLDAKDYLIEENLTKLPKERHVLRTYCFPEYIRYEFEGVSGYLPLSINDMALNENGGTVTVFVHIGHSMTYVKMIGGNRRDIFKENLDFEYPESQRIIGDKGCDSETYGYFVTANKGKSRYGKYFRNMLHGFRKSNEKKFYTDIRPFQDGQILFDKLEIDYSIRKDMISFFNFEYNLMDETNKRNVHIFAEEILLYAAQIAIKRGYTNMRIEYLYSFGDSKNELGELEGLWGNAFRWVKKWTGIYGEIGQAIKRMDEPEALSWLLYYHTYRNSLYNSKKGKQKELYVGVDVGWSKTLVCMLNSKNDCSLESKWAQINFAGREISMMNGRVILENYPESLSILLRGIEKIEGDGEDDNLLSKFEDLNKDINRNTDLYQGLFDIIAMRIEDADFMIPTDVYNRKQQFRALIETITYNIFMLFLNIGYTITKLEEESSEEEIKIHIFLSGNGAKFLKWVSNTKKANIIDESNGKEYFICQTEKGLPQIVIQGFKIVNKDKKEITCKIILANSDEQLIDGYVFKRSNKKLENINLDKKKINDCFKDDLGNVFCQELDSMKQNFIDAVFKVNKWGGSHNDECSATEIIKNEAEEITLQLAQAIRDM